MDFLDFFENMGLGLTIVVIFVVGIFLLTLLGAFVPMLFAIFSRLLSVLIILVVIGAVIYFIGGFAKGFIKK